MSDTPRTPPPPGWPTGTATPEDFMKAHQYLYYVKSDPVWDDFQYDAYCKQYGLFGGGGSDSAADYAPDIIKLAEGIWRYWHKNSLLPDQKANAALRPAAKPRKVTRGKKATTAPL